MKKIFIDGKAGTTGLRIFDRLIERKDIDIISLSDEQRKDLKCRKDAINRADIAFLCLPDDAAAEAVSMVEGDTIVIDTSCAHRTAPGWAYGFPELSAQHEEKIRRSKRISVPGCHASGFIALIYPLIESGIIKKDIMLYCNSITGYSGGGRKMIDEYGSEDRSVFLSAPRQYALSQKHKHLKEMREICGLELYPMFSPVVSDFYSGMEVTVPLFKEQLVAGYAASDIIRCYKDKYKGPIVGFEENPDENGFLSASLLSGKDIMKISVFGNEDRILLTAIYDNLGKGASGAAVECLNLILGEEKTKGLVL